MARHAVVGFLTVWWAIAAAGAARSAVGEAEAATPAASFYVALDGDDANPGTVEMPLRSLEAARQKVRDHVAAHGLEAGGIAVVLRQGTWLRSQSFVLSSPDSGAEGAPVVWRAFPGETVRIVGAVPLDPAWFGPVLSADPEWSRLPLEARGQALRADLEAHGINDFGQLRLRGGGDRATGALELFVDGLPMPLARWPDPDEHDGQSSGDTSLTMFGNPVPDVSGFWTAFGTRDGVNAYVRDEPVGGVTYHLYRQTWFWDGNWHTAWFIAAQDGGYPGSAHPWWYLYKQDLGTFEPANGATGRPTIVNPEGISWGFAAIGGTDGETVFQMANSRVGSWSTAADPWFFGFWKYHWADKHVAAASINPATRTITLAARPGYGIAAGMPFFAENLLEEITRPGEWYLDRGTGHLYLWPDGSLEGREIMVSMLEEPVLQVQDAEHIQLVNLEFGLGRSDLVVVDGGRDVLFDRCRFYGAGNDGLRLDGTGHRLQRSEVVDTGDRGILVQGGDRPSLTGGGNQVENTEIHRFGRWSWTYMPGIHLLGVGHRAAHNHLHDAPHSAILFRGNLHLIELNEIDDVCRYSSDAGAIYSGRRWDWRGNRIEFNFIHDIDSPFPGAGEHGVYLDDCLSGVRVFGNLIVDVSGHALMHGGGRDDLFENNIAVRCGTMLHSDSRGSEWIKNDNSDWDLRRRLHDDGVEYQLAPWCSTWPELCVIPDADVPQESHLRFPEGSVFSRNLGWDNANFIVDGNWSGVTALDKFAEIEDNIGDTDPRFRNESAGDYRLAGDSPAWSIPGFVELPFPEMGIVDGLRLIFEDGFEWGDTSEWSGLQPPPGP